MPRFGYVLVQVLEILAGHCRQTLAGCALEHIDASASAASRHDAVQRFNAAQG